jgi:hypothetical protein
MATSFTQLCVSTPWCAHACPTGVYCRVRAHLTSVSACCFTQAACGETAAGSLRNRNANNYEACARTTHCVKLLGRAHIWSLRLWTLTLHSKCEVHFRFKGIETSTSIKIRTTFHRCTPLPQTRLWWLGRANINPTLMCRERHRQKIE